MSVTLAGQEKSRQDLKTSGALAAERTIKILRVIARMNIGGPARQVALLTVRLDSTRFQTLLVTGRLNSSEGDLSYSLSLETRHVRLAELGRAIHPWYDLIALWKLCHFVWRYQPDVIHTHTAKAGTLGRLAGLLYNWVGPGRDSTARTRLIHTFHGHVLEGYFNPAATRVFVMIERWLARRTDCLIAVSPAVRDELLSKGIGVPRQWRVIPLGFDLTSLRQLRAPKDDGTVTIGMVGRLVPIKNPSVFLQALARLHYGPMALNLRGAMIGDGPLRPALEREAAQLGLEDRIVFTGWQRDLQAVYGALDIVCLTSWNEGTPVALIEAMAAGRTVVATDVGGVRDLLEDEGDSRPPITNGAFHVAARGIVVRPGDVAGLAAALRAVATDEELRGRLGRVAREHVIRYYGAERLCRDIQALYDALLRRD